MTKASPKTDLGKRDFGFRDVFGISWRIFVQHFRTVAIAGFGVYLPIEAFMAWVAPPVAGIKDQFEIMQVESLFEILFGTIAAVIVIRLTANAIDREPTSLAEVWKAAKRRYFSSVATTIAMNLVFLGLAILLLIPGLVGAVYMSFYLQVTALREDTGFHALKHSKRVVEGSFWRVTAYAVFFMVAYEGLASLNTFVPIPWLAVLLGGVGDVVNLYFTMATTVLYLHLDRTRFGYEEE